MKIFQGIYISFFFLVLLLPGLQSQLNLFPNIKLDEKRAVKEYPSGNPLKQIFLNPAFSKQYEESFDDRYGFRALLIKLKNQINYSLFNYSKQCLIGADGWLDDRIANEHGLVNVDSLSPKEIESIVEHIGKLKQKLAEAGIQLVLIPLPWKNLIYPQYFEKVFTPKKERTGYFRFLKELERHQIEFVNAYEVFKKSQEYLVYYKTDMHWTAYGATQIAQATVRKLSELLHKEVPWKFSQEYKLSSFIGADSSNLGILFPLTEQTPIFKNDWPACGKYPAGGDPANVGLPFARQYNPDLKCAGETLPQLLLIGNSYMMNLYGNGFLDHFSRTISLHDLTQFPRVIQNIPSGTKIVVWQFFEAQIPVQLMQTEWWSQLDSELTFVDVPHGL